jgi:ubiquitin carboxyl-terminal hydrolase 1
MNPNQPISMRPTSVNDSDSNDRYSSNIYRIASLIVHFGSHSNGHYVSYRRRPRRGCSKKGLLDDWFRISDEDIDKANLQEVLSANPFMLFYERVERSQAGSDATVEKRGTEHGLIVEAWQMAHLKDT